MRILGSTPHARRCEYCGHNSPYNYASSTGNYVCKPCLFAGRDQQVLYVPSARYKKVRDKF